MHSCLFLSAVQKTIVNQIWDNPRNDDDLLVKAFGYEIKGVSLKRCKGRTFLDDQVINFYFAMIGDRSKTNPKPCPKVFIFSSFFYDELTRKGHKGVKRWTKHLSTGIIYTC